MPREMDRDYDYDRGRNDRGYESRSGRGRGVPDYGQGGYFGDYEGHSDIGRRGGEVRHERAMRAHRDAGDYEYGGRGRSRYDDEDDDRRYRRH